MIGNLNKKDIIAILYITILTITAVVYGFSIIPSPIAEQTIANDHKRVSDLGNIKSSIESYYQSNNTLPAALSDVSNNTYDTSTNSLEITDPLSKQPYDYSTVTPTEYRLCATFTTNSFSEKQNVYDDTNPDYTTYSTQFRHPSGYYCFTEHVLTLYRPFQQQPKPLQTAPTIYSPSVTPTTNASGRNY